MTNTRAGRAAAFAAALVLALSAAGCSSGQPGTDPAAMVGSTGPNLAGPDLTGPGRVDLARLTGKPTVLVFWLYACPHCREYLPRLQRAWQEAAPDAHLVSVAMMYPDPGQIDGAAGFDSPEAFVTSTGLTVPTVVVPPGVSDAWQVDGVPTVIVLGADHKVRSIFDGEPDPAEVLREVDRLTTDAPEPSTLGSPVADRG